jgi:hypothetical protein
MTTNRLKKISWRPSARSQWAWGAPWHPPASLHRGVSLEPAQWKNNVCPRTSRALFWPGDAPHAHAQLHAPTHPPPIWTAAATVGPPRRGPCVPSATHREKRRQRAANRLPPTDECTHWGWAGRTEPPAHRQILGNVWPCYRLRPRHSAPNAAHEQPGTRSTPVKQHHPPAARIHPGRDRQMRAPGRIIIHRCRGRSRRSCQPGDHVGKWWSRLSQQRPGAQGLDAHVVVGRLMFVPFSWTIQQTFRNGLSVLGPEVPARYRYFRAAFLEIVYL